MGKNSVKYSFRIFNILWIGLGFFDYFIGIEF
jgi:hypothetical protein